MAVTKITIDEFLLLAKNHPVLDVRSPGEYAHAHMPDAVNLPLFNDEERAKVGTTYKQQSRENAIKIGLDFFGPNMRGVVERVEEIVAGYGLGVTGINTQKKINSIIKNTKDVVTNPQLETPKPATVLLHCWRGGMRSAAVGWLLDLYGFKVYTLIGGYKAYRNWVLQQFTKDYHFKIIGGYTGSGKTLLLHALAKENNRVIDLEGLANHKGSALGALGNPPQPTQEMFENLLAKELDDRQQTTDNEQHQLHNESSKLNEPTLNLEPLTFNPIWLEDESQRIGNLQIPMPLWYCMRKAPVYFVDIPFEERLNYLTEEYGVHEKTGLVNAIMRIQKRLGGLETKNAINFLLENNFKESFRILLHYYDKWYAKGLYNRENAEELIMQIPATAVNTEQNIQLIKLNNN
ncbi:MAG: tRNA 2-selenouridine(34) synthase MnmH [Ferruginibacter sp.]